jgi:ADP-ribose pyrophosphatase YjhB (NUDIX family)
LYAESDGQVYLVQDNDGRWTFPSLADDVPFDFAVLHETNVRGDHVVFARPTLAEHPDHWVFKDAVPTMEPVDPVVRQAINASLARCVVGVVLVDDEDRVLMVKSTRGFTKGMWNIPGGFIEYGEHPEAAAVREIREEVGLTIRPGRLLGVFMERFESPYFMYGFMYEAVAPATDVTMDPSEIAEARWMEPAAAIRSTHNPFAVAAFRLRFPGTDA